MPSLVDCIVRATSGVACAMASLTAIAFVHAEAPGIVVIEAPFGYPSDLRTVREMTVGFCSPLTQPLPGGERGHRTVISRTVLNQLVTNASVAPISPVTYQAHRPATTWDIFNGFEREPNQVGKPEVHEHDHDIFGNCESCLAFQQSRREMLARAFEKVIARYEQDTLLDLDEEEIEGFAIDAGEIERIRIRPEQDDAYRDRPTSGQEEVMVKFGPLSQVSINTAPKLEKSTELPPNLARKRYVPYETAMAFGGGEAKPWSSRTFCWRAPSFYHRPLYFEQVNLERYGHYHKNWHIESILSAAHFFGNIPILPLRLGAYHPCERVYTLGRYRPGDCNPNHKYLIPITWKGILKQGLTTTALVFAL